MNIAAVETLLGGDAYFVPCEIGTKLPLVTYVERPFAGTKSDAYRALFNAQPVNIAVYLGKASGGLCAIDFDRDDDLASFDALNPELRSTLRSRGSRGAMLWLRIEGDYPESCTTPLRVSMLIWCALVRGSPASAVLTLAVISPSSTTCSLGRSMVVFTVRLL